MSDEVIEIESFEVRGHTPGTWTYGLDGVPVGSAYVNVVSKMYRKAINADHVVATIRRGSDQWEDNARLIAAAPELLEQCKYLLENAEAEGWSEFIVKDARAAISKAEGRGE